MKSLMLGSTIFVVLSGGTYAFNDIEDASASTEIVQVQRGDLARLGTELHWAGERQNRNLRSTQRGRGSLVEIVPLKNAVDGSQVRLSQSDGPDLVIEGRHFAEPITIDASGIELRSIVIRDSSGIRIKGGRVEGPGDRSYAVHLENASHISIEGMVLTKAHRGVVIHKSDNVDIVGNDLVALISDGINISQSRAVNVRDNVCRDFTPTPAIYDESGKLVQDGDHPDCIQAWSRPETAPVADITIVGNEAHGKMQGIFFGNHTRNGVSDGGFDNVVVRDNYVKVTHSNGIYLKDARGSTVTENEVHTVEGSVLPNKPDVVVKTKIAALGEGPYRVCNNIVSAVPWSDAVKPCS